MGLLVLTPLRPETIDEVYLIFRNLPHPKSNGLMMETELEAFSEMNK